MSRTRESNPEPTAYETVALPLSQFGKMFQLSEVWCADFHRACFSLRTETRHVKIYLRGGSKTAVVSKMGFEPTLCGF